MNSTLNIEQLQEIHCELARRKFSKFVQFMIKDYDMTWFHESVMNNLQKLYNGEIKKLMIFIPPQHGKSFLSSILFPSWVLGKNPNTKIALCSYSDTMASGFNKKTQLVIDNHKYNKVFPKTTLNSGIVAQPKSNEQRNSNIFEIVGHNGSYKSVGIGGALTGSSVDIGIIDDPFKDYQEANSITIRNKVWDWYVNVFLTRLHNNSKQLMLFTRWHEDDLAGRILNKTDNPYYNEDEANSWVVVKYEALKESNDNPEDPREINEALYPKKHSQEKLVKQKKISPFTFASLFQQNPTTNEGEMFLKEWFTTISENYFYQKFNPKDITWHFFVDTANTENTQNDPTGISQVCYINEILYIKKVVGEYINAGDLPFWIHDFVLSNGYKNGSGVFIEQKSNGIATLNFMQNLQNIKKDDKIYSRLNVCPYVFPNNVAQKSRYDRAIDCVPFCISNRVVFIQDDSTKIAIDQITKFPKAKHDDILDAAIIMPIYYFTNPNADYAKQVAKYF